ncbi:hypothetical protein NBRC116601_18900 [Cognatishimia sp. WU-CL00825]
MAKLRMQAQVARVVIAALIGVYLFYVTKGLFKAAHRNRSPGLWGGAAVLITGSLTFVSAHFAYDPWAYKRLITDNLSRIPPSAALLAEVTHVQASLPRPMSKSVQIQSAELRKRELVFLVDAKGKVADTRVKAIEDKMWQTLTVDHSYCAELRAAFDQGLWTAVYEFRYEDAVFFARLGPKQCAAVAPHQDLIVKKRL